VRPGDILPGIVTNITRFGAFVDVGVKQDGLVHVSEIANRYISDPNEVLKLNDKVKVKVLEVDTARKRISLSIKQTQENKDKTSVRNTSTKKQGQTSNNMHDALSLLKKKFGK
ncbi:S1 RNA-binding domain-containing protein, partial [Pseudomonas aeruginosa]